MKKTIYLFISLIILASCDDALVTYNKNQLDKAAFFKTENDLKLAVNTAYTPLAQDGMFGLGYFLHQNTLDPYIWFENPNSGLDKMLIGISDFSTTWRDLYIGLFRTSDILANISRLDGKVSDENMKIYKGQLTALRGMYYFYLVTWFNKPIYYDETNVPTDPFYQFSNAEPELFWNKLEEDLTFAASNLPATWGNEDKGRITKGAASAQLGKSLLYKHFHYYLRFGKGNSAEAKNNLLKAKNALKAVVDGQVYKLIQAKANTKKDFQAALLSNSSYLDIPVGNNIYPAENNDESVWEIQYNDDTKGNTGWLPGWQWGGNLNYMYFSSHLLAYKNQEIDPTLWYEFETTSSHIAGYDRDPRAYATCFLDGDTMDWRPSSGYNVPFSSALNSKRIVSSKNLYNGATPSVAIGLKKYNYPQFTEKSAPNCAPFNVRVIRYADVLLMYAEACYLYDGDSDGSGLAALNQVRRRAGMPDQTALTPEIIVHERNVELATEGHRYNDIVRWAYSPEFNIDLGALFKYNFDTNKNFYYPIPQSEINANRGTLKQNPGW